MIRLVRATTFALGMALASVAQSAQQPLTGDIETVPGGGSAPDANGLVLPVPNDAVGPTFAPEFKTRDFAEGWCEGYKFAVQLSQRTRDELRALTKAHKITPEVDELILSVLDEAALPEMSKSWFTLTTTEDHQTVECK